VALIGGASGLGYGGRKGNILLIAMGRWPGALTLPLTNQVTRFC